jgi:CheY-like chemotaxis protein
VPRILIVDDQAHVRSALAIALRANGIDAVAADDAASGLREFATRQFDLAIVDVYMPNIDGVKLIKALRERAPDLPIIAISGVVLNESQRTVLEYLPKLPGMSEIVCLKKPFRPAALLQAVRAALTIEA